MDSILTIFTSDVLIRIVDLIFDRILVLQAVSHGRGIEIIRVFCFVLQHHERKYETDIQSINIDDALLQNNCQTEMQATQPHPQPPVNLNEINRGTYTLR